jgi:hypothetical protein
MHNFVNIVIAIRRRVIDILDIVKLRFIAYSDIGPMFAVRGHLPLNSFYD